MTSIKTTTKIDWNNIKIRVVSVGKEHPDEHNLYERLSAEEREQVIVSIFEQYQSHIAHKKIR